MSAIKTESLGAKIFDLFMPKADSAKPACEDLVPLTVEDRARIKKYFPDSMHEKMADGEFLFTQNSYANYGRCRISFYNENGTLMASLAHHRSEDEVGNPRVVPLCHTEHEVDTDPKMEEVKRLAQ